MNNRVGFFEDAFEQGATVAKQTAKQVAGLPSSAAKTAANQVTPGLTPQATLQGEEKTEDSLDNKKKKTNPDPKPLKAPKNTTQILRGQFIKPKPEQIIKQQQDLQKVRAELHQDYFKNLTDRPKKQEERSAEKIDREEKEEEQKKILVEQKKQKEDAALVNVRQGTGEKITGIGG